MFATQLSKTRTSYSRRNTCKGIKLKNTQLGTSILRTPRSFIAGQQLVAPPSFLQPKVDRRSLRSCSYYGTRILARMTRCSPEIYRRLVRRCLVLRERNSTCLHIYLRHRVVFKVFIVVIIQNVIIVKRHSLRSKHIGEERELFLFETLVQLLLFSPFFILQALKSVSV